MSVRVLLGMAVISTAILIMAGCPGTTVTPGPLPSRTLTVLAWNDLGMHCMDKDTSEMMILPPYNVLHAQVIRRAEEPDILTGGVTVRYAIPGNTTSANKCNFWTNAPALFGAGPADNIGLTGNGMAGVMTPIATNDWQVTGIPITPLTDAMVENPYQLATVSVEEADVTVTSTQAVAPVSWEINCQLCHNAAGVTAATDILRAHDRLHATTLEAEKPVLCGRCHAQPPLGTAGTPGTPSLSRAMHGAHASRMAVPGLAAPCYACHPGIRTKCLRDVHASEGMTCVDCHQGMTAVADAGRQPWVDEPRCGDCHRDGEKQFEQAGTLYRNSRGHKGVKCAACHGSPHAITPTSEAADNVQAIALQGHAGTIDKCTVCHTQKPGEGFEHTFGG